MKSFGLSHFSVVPCIVKSETHVQLTAALYASITPVKPLD